MAKQRIFDLPVTKGTFTISGVTTGTEKDNFYKELVTKSKKNMRMVNFGIEIAPGSTVYEAISGMEQDNVYYTHRKEDGKNETVAVPWLERNTFNKDGYSIIGDNIGLTKVVDANGKIKNDIKHVVDYDACKIINDNMEDDMSVFTRGNLEFSSYTNDKGVKYASVKFAPTQVSLMSNDVDFTAEDFTPYAHFNQTIVVTGIAQEKDDKEKPTGRFIVSAKIVTYSTIEDAEFIILDKDLANNFKMFNKKPYQSILVNGDIVVSKSVEEVADDDHWGQADATKRVSSPTKREFIITGATPSTIDKETYSEDKINEAMAAVVKAKKAESDFGDKPSSDNWGTVGTSDEDDDEAGW